MDYVTKWGELRQILGEDRPAAQLRRLALSALAALATPKPQNALRVLCSHYVFDDQIEDFDRKIKFLLTIGAFVDAAGVLAHLRGETTSDRPLFHLTFDDARRNVVTNALPVLRAHGVPATFFVATSRLGAHLPMSRGGRAVEMARWDDLAAAQTHGLEIASHTRAHPRLAAISGNAARLEDEICGSKALIESRLGRPCRYFAWPYGRRADIDAAATQWVKRAGYEASFGAFRGAVESGVTDAYAIPRHHVEADWPLSHLKFFALGGREKTARIRALSRR